MIFTMIVHSKHTWCIPTDRYTYGQPAMSSPIHLDEFSVTFFIHEVKDILNPQNELFDAVWLRKQATEE